MRKFISLVLVGIIASGITLSLLKIPFGTPKTKVGNYYLNKGIDQTGAVNIVTSVVLNYRGFDTLGEVTVLFIAALGLGMITSTFERRRGERISPSFVLSTGCRFLFPFILLFGTYIFLHGHLTPGGGFQGGAIIASGFLLVYLGCKRTINKERFKVTESLAGLVFLIIGLIGLYFSGYFLFNFLPKGVANTLFSAGIIPLIYIAIGFKVGAELAGIIDGLMEEK
ncbi:Na(+)/H(+) antiporter subunit B [Candidatus Calescamantes bacterium]|nr:Na(+)/H(+) antiporter subunit B [Candidatus Calescamantes bacterium]